MISTQVLQEFYVVATTRLKIDPLQAKEMVHAFSHEVGAAARIGPKHGHDLCYHRAFLSMPGNDP